jgi:bacillithiol system protein YtxJ
MSGVPFDLPEDPAEAVSVLAERSRDAPCVVFKESPTCSISTSAESAFRRWLAGRPDLAVCFIDVIEQRALARGITRQLGIRHDSPQVLVFEGGGLAHHASHFELDAAWFDAHIRG